MSKNFLRNKFRSLNKQARLLLFKRRSNIYMVLLSFKYRHLITITSGVSKISNNKKQKISVYNLPYLITILIKYLTKYDIKFLNIIIRQKRIIRHFRSLQKLLKINNIYIKSYKYILKRVHGFIRKKKKRRI